MGKDIATTLKIAGLLSALFLAYLFRGALVQPPPVDPAHAFNTERAYARLARILGDETPHPVDSAANDTVIARLVTEIETLGFTPIMRDAFHCVETWRGGRCARLQNIAFWVTPPGPNAVLVMSHHDSVPAGPGASDDGAGVAASLEIASLMKDRALSRPLLVLITDGEELGLMGANMFVKNDPLAKQVSAVVNMEARGISGLATLIQTSRPNGRDLQTLSGQTRLPAASSLNADIYELLPNDTDMTEFLHLPVDAANLAYAGDVAFYHTPGDTLANMDKRALFNLGASGLAATDTFLHQIGDEAESQLLYVDILGQFVVKFPNWLGALILLLGAAMALALLWSLRQTTKLWRVAFVPIAALVLGLVLAIGLTMLVALIRPEQLFASGSPIALRGLHASAALMGTMVIYTFMTRPGEAKALLASSWAWSAVLGLIAYFTVKGAAIVFALPMIVFAVAALALYFSKDRLGLVLAGLGAALFALIALPLTALGEGGLFIESSAPFAFVLVLLFAYSAPLLWPKESALLRSFWLTLVGTATASVAFFVASIFVPAYSVDTPRALSITHIQSNIFQETVWSVFGTEAVPNGMQQAAAFEAGVLPVLGGPRQIAPAPKIPAELRIALIENSLAGDLRKLVLEIEAPDTDRLNISFGTQMQATQIKVNDFALENPASLSRVICSGRSCRNLELTIIMPSASAPPAIDMLAYRFGLGAIGADLIAARPGWAIAKQSGDMRIQHHRIDVPNPG